MDEDDLAHLLAAASAEVHRSPQEQPTVEAVVHAAIDMVPSATDASITVRTPRRRHLTIAATSDAVRQADQLQYELDEGPCVEAAEGSTWLRSGNVGVDARWPTWGPRAAQLGVGSMLSIALSARGERIGALNLYASEEGQFSERDEIELAVLFTVHAAQALASARLVTGLEVALSSRHHIGVAQGIVMERYGVTLEQSFALLRRISSHTNQKLADIAEHIVTTNEIPTINHPDAP